MPSAVRVLSNSETAAQANEYQFEQIRALAADFEKRDVKAKDALYSALDALFTFVMDIEAESERRAFVENQKGKWGKVARDNPFQPFVKLIFDGKGISDASRSQYASVLRYAEFKRDKSISLVDWLKVSGGVDGLYKAAADFFPKPRDYVERTKLNNAVQSIKAQKLSGKFNLTGNDVAEGYVMALLHVDTNGDAHVVEYTERDQAKLDVLFEKLAKAEAKKSGEADKPLFALCRAIRLLMLIAPSGKADQDRLITLSRGVNDEGHAVVKVRAISTDYEGSRGEILLYDMIAWVPAEGLLAFGQSDATRFCDAFAINGAWTCDGHTMVHDEQTIADITLLDGIPAVPKDGRYFERRADFQKVAPLTINYDGAVSFREQYQRNTSRKAYRGALSLKWTGDYLRYQPHAVGGASHDVVRLTVDPEFGDDRLFGSDMLAGVCGVTGELQSDVTGWLVSTPEEDSCAIFIDHEAGKDRVRLVMPLIKNAQGHATQTNIAVA